MNFSDMGMFADLKEQRNLPEKLAKIHVEQGVFRGLDLSRPTCTFAPQHYERGYAYPLVLWLHTPGMNETQLWRVMPMVSLRNYVAVAIRGSQTVLPNGCVPAGYHWSAESYDSVCSSVFEAVEAARKRYHIAHDRVYLAGSQAGGTMALRIAFRNPTYFAGAASLDGAIPEDTTLLEYLMELKRVRFLFAVSRNSQTCPVDRLCEHLGLLHAAGLAVTLKNYPTAGALQTDMLRDLDRWMMGHIETAMM
ncbi:MAG: hypothetical protein Q4D98_09660 [Planctomycetia bacterium]|nr:hypothetical protein [Planctomycetia bacterium]